MTIPLFITFPVAQIKCGIIGFKDMYQIFRQINTIMKKVLFFSNRLMKISTVIGMLNNIKAFININFLRIVQ
jgi:hypothetical protein